MKAPLLEAKNLRISYRSADGPVSLVHGIDFQIAERQTVGLVGESGSGKTLTGRAIMGMLSPRTMVVQSDRLALEGQPIVQRERGALTRDVAMIFQNPFTSLNPTLTIGQFLREVIRRKHGLSGRAAKARALELLESVRIPNAAQKLDSYPHQLSGGQQQRVVIAVALALEPKLLIADEPTTALDVTVQAGIIKLLAKLQEERGMGLLFISHDLSLVSDIASEVIVLYQGNIAETGDRSIMTGSAVHPYTKALLAASPSVHHRKPSLNTSAVAWIDNLEGATE